MYFSNRILILIHLSWGEGKAAGNRFHEVLLGKSFTKTALRMASPPLLRPLSPYPFSPLLCSPPSYRFTRFLHVSLPFSLFPQVITVIYRLTNATFCL